MRAVGSMGALLWIIMDYGWKCEPWLADLCDVRGWTPLHVLKDGPGYTGCVDESDREPLGWHQWHDWHMKGKLDMLDSGLLSCSSGIISILCLWRPVGHKNDQLPPSARRGAEVPYRITNLEVFTPSGIRTSVLIKWKPKVASVITQAWRPK